MKKALILSAFILFSCNGRIYRTVYPLLNDGKYDSEFPYKNCSQEIKAICDMTVKIYCTTQYKIYYFDRNDKMTRRDIQERGLLHCQSTSFSENPIAGSGLVIAGWRWRRWCGGRGVLLQLLLLAELGDFFAQGRDFVPQCHLATPS